jgi:hypothetical protein
MASGGLTHFVIDEEFDRRVIDAMKAGDEETLARFPESYFKVGTAEIKNWYPVIAVPPDRLRPLLSIGGGHGQRDVLRVLGVTSGIRDPGSGIRGRTGTPRVGD